MPLSLRFPRELEREVASFSARAGISKSAVIVRSVREFLAARTQPSAHALYEAEMQAAAQPPARRADKPEMRSRKLKFQALMRAKRAARTALRKGASSRRVNKA